MTDDDIRRNVEAELRWECAAERAAERVRGVTAVVSHLCVRPSRNLERTDDDIAPQGVANGLGWNPLIPDNSVTVKVSKAWVTLNGVVSSQYQRDAAENVVRDLAGVRGVSNLIRLNSPGTHGVTTSDIEAPKRRAQVDADRIRVKASSRDVTLTGTACSCAESKEAERTVWSGPGVCSVDNRIEVEAWSSDENERYSG